MTDLDLAAIRAALDEDERVALAASGQGQLSRNWVAEPGNSTVAETYWDPAAVGEVDPYAAGDRSCYGCGAGNDGEMLVADVKDCPVVRALASVYGQTGGA
jgi:hypothetical protein